MLDTSLTKNKKIVLLFFLFSLTINLFFNIAVMGIENEITISSDASAYINRAQNISDYLFKTEDSRYPIWPLFLSFLMSLFGFNLFWIKLILSILGAVNCILIFLIAQKFVRRNIAIITLMIACLNPNLIFWTAYLLTETLCHTLFLLGLYLLTLDFQKGSTIKLISSGIILGLSALTRSSIIVFFPFILILIVLKYYPGFKIIITKFIFIFLPISILLVTWAFRNYKVSGVFTLQTNSAAVLYGTWNEWAFQRDSVFDRGAWRSDYSEKFPELKYMEYKDKKIFLQKRFINYIKTTLREKPFDLLKIAYWNIKRGMFGRLWNRTSIMKYIFFIYYNLLSLLGLMGIVITFKEKKKYLFLYMGIIAFILTIIVAGGIHRFRVPFESFFLILSSITIYGIFFKIKFNIFKKKKFEC